MTLLLGTFVFGLVTAKFWKVFLRNSDVDTYAPTFEWETVVPPSIYDDASSNRLHRASCPIDDSNPSVPRRTGDEAKRIASSRVPTVFSAMDCFDWWYPRMENQDVDRITDIHMGRHRLREIRVSSDPTFRLRNVPHRPWLRQPDVSLLSAETPPEYTFRNTTLDTFFDMPKRWVAEDGARTRGYAQCSNSIEGTEIEAEITATGEAVLEFALDETAKASRFGLKHQTGTKTVLWLNTAGSRSATHFDRTHNFVLQLDGKKKWTLYPPSSWPHLAFEPYMHVGYDTSRRSFDGEDDDARIRSYEVETVQGDVLYIPPFWSTKVETIRNSAHLSINSPSLEQMMIAKAYWRIHPFLDEWSVTERVVAFWALMNELCDALDVGVRLANHVSARDFLRVGLRSRYERLLAERSRDDASADMDVASSFQCDDPNTDASENLIREYRVLAAEVANDLAEIKRSVVRIFLLDLAEELVMSVMRSEDDPSVVVDFVDLCLR